MSLCSWHLVEGAKCTGFKVEDSVLRNARLVLGYQGRWARVSKKNYRTGYNPTCSRLHQPQERAIGGWWVTIGWWQFVGGSLLVAIGWWQFPGGNGLVAIGWWQLVGDNWLVTISW